MVSSAPHVHPRADFDWLRLRYSVDAAARNQRLEREALGRLAARQRLRVLDLGSGAGANYYYYSRLLAPCAEWWLVERDAELLGKLPQFGRGLAEPARSKRAPPDIYAIAANFLDGESPVYGRCYDLVLANAVFDLLSIGQFQALLQLFRHAWTEDAPVFLFTLNLEGGIQFNPSDSDTEAYCRLYTKHMQRPQYFGQAMGADCATLMENLFWRNGFDVRRGLSVWEISPTETKLLQAMVDFFETAIPELVGTRSNSLKIFNRWLYTKKEQILNGLLSIRVPHCDFLATIA